MIICETVGDLKRALETLPDDLPFQIYYEGYSCLADFLTVRGVWDGDGPECLVLDTEDRHPDPKSGGEPVWPGIVSVSEYASGARPDYDAAR